MPELPRMLPQAQVQPGAQTPGIGIRNDTGTHNVASGIDSLEGFFQQLSVQEAQTSAMNQAADDHVEYLARLSDLRQQVPDPNLFQQKSQELAKEYLTGRDKQLSEKLGRRAMAIYKQHFNPRVEAGFAESIKEATAQRVAQATPALTSTAEKLVRDMLAQGPESPGWNDGLKGLNQLFDAQNPTLIPNKEILRQKSLDDLFLGVAVQQARSNPSATLKRLSSGTGYEVSIGSGLKDVTKLDPTMRETLTRVAYDELSKQQTQATLAREADNRDYDAFRKRNDFNASLRIMQGDPAAMNFVNSNGLDERGRPIIDASDLRSLFNFQNTVLKAQTEGTVTNPVAYGLAMAKIRRAEMGTMELMATKDVSFDDKKQLAAKIIELDNKMLDRDYAAFHEQKKRGENFIRAQLKAINPIAGFGKPDTTAETLVARYHAIVEEKEAVLRNIPDAKVTGIAPMDIAAEFIKGQEEHLAKQYKHDVKPLISQMKEFLPASSPVTYASLYKNIDDSPRMNKTEKLIMRAVAYQMEQQGVTTDQINQQLRGVVTGEMTPSSDSKFLDWFGDLTRKARESFDGASKWFKGDNVGE